MIRVLNLGAGVQSTTLYLMMMDGLIPTVDLAIFADTREEPREVYQHVDFLKSLGGPEIVTVSAGSIGENLIEGVNSTGQRFVSIPAFLSESDNGENTGIGRRQCTSEYKIVPIEAEIRRRYGVERNRSTGVYRRLPNGTQVTQIFGLSFDEPKRVARVRDRFTSRRDWFVEFPLFDEFMTRADCLFWLKRRLPSIQVPRSACVFCPYRTDEEWIHLRSTDPDGFARAVEIDHAIRETTSVCTRGMDAAQYLHRSCKPLDQVVFEPKPAAQPRLSFAQMDCEGMCGV